MTTSTLPLPASSLLSPAVTAIRTIVVAIDGTQSSDPALIAARVLAERLDATVHVVTVADLPTVVDPNMQLTTSVELEELHRAACLTRARDQLARTLGSAHGLPLQLGVGDPSRTIARIARSRGADLTVIGIGRHALSDRFFGDEVAVQLTRQADTPVLCVDAHATPLASRVLIATDFSTWSDESARLALQYVHPSATVFLAHVQPTAIDPAELGLGGTPLEYVERGFSRLEAHLQAPSTMRLDRVLLRGEASRELLAFAEGARIDLIVSGSHGHGLLGRLLLGSVSTRVLRGAHCSVFIAPKRWIERMEGNERLASARQRPLRREWELLLDDFTRRNTGRRARLEIDQPELGAQLQQTGFPFLGATYDPKNDHVELMFGDLVNGSRHLARSIADVSAVTLQSDSAGRDIALRIQHGDGQTLVLFDRL